MRRLIVILTIAVAFSGAPDRADGAADISGTWGFSVDVGGTQGTPTFVFKQAGEKLSGTVTNARGEQRVTGTVKGDRAVFGFEASRDGQSVKATYTGTIESATRMTGTVVFSGARDGTGSWVAIKK